MAPLLAGFSGLPARAPVSLFFVSQKKKRGAFCFLCLYSKGEPTENPRSPKNRGAYEEKNQRSFSFATNKTRAVPFLRCLLSTWVVATNTRVFLRRRRAGLLLVRYKQHHSSTTTIEFVLPFFLGVNARQALQCAEFLSSCLV